MLPITFFNSYLNHLTESLLRLISSSCMYSSKLNLMIIWGMLISADCTFSYSKKWVSMLEQGNWKSYAH